MGLDRRDTKALLLGLLGGAMPADYKVRFLMENASATLEAEDRRLLQSVFRDNIEFDATGLTRFDLIKMSKRAVIQPFRRRRTHRSQTITCNPIATKKQSPYKPPARAFHFPPHRNRNRVHPLRDKKCGYRFSIPRDKFFTLPSA